MNILITGSLGYIGSALLRELNPSNFGIIRILDNLSVGKVTSMMNLSENTSDNTMQYSPELVIGDIRTKEEDVFPAMENVTTVIHLAGVTTLPQYSPEMIGRTMSINVSGTETLLDVAEDCGVSKFIYASTCNVYGNNSKLNLSEGDPIDPLNPYARTKYLAEQEVLKRKSLNPLCLRLATNYGWSPGIRWNLVINKFVMYKAMKEPLSVYGEGNNWRAFIHVQDTARAFLHGLEKNLEGIYNVGDVNLTVQDIVRLLNYDNITYFPEREKSSYHVSFDKFEKTGFAPVVSIESGIRDLELRFGYVQKN